MIAFGSRFYPIKKSLRLRARRGFCRASLLCPALAVILLTIPLSACIADETTKAETPTPDCADAFSEAPIRDYTLWPLIYEDKAPEWRQFSFIPFYTKWETADELEERRQFLWPIYSYRRSDRDVSIRVLPIINYWKDVYDFSDGEEYDTDYSVFPIIHGGDSSEEGKSFALFPVAGKLKNFWGRDEISFFLFPLYMEYYRNEHHQRNYLWPILSFSEGGDYSGFRLWPLHGYFEEEGVSREEFWLWPIFHRQVFDLDKEQSGSRFMIFPLYAREDTARRRYRAYLWPFFDHEENYAKNFEQYSRPWPFYVKAWGDIERTQVWPIYGFTKTADQETRFVLWPIWRENVYTIDEETKRRTATLMPFIALRTDTSESEGVLEHKFRFWPLWRFRRYEDGSTRFRTLSLLWFDDERGFERHYSPLWTLYEREEHPGGCVRSRALLGLIRHQHSLTRSETRIPILYSRIEDREQGLKKINVLGGLFATQRTEEKRKLRLFYILNF